MGRTEHDWGNVTYLSVVEVLRKSKEYLAGKYPYMDDTRWGRTIIICVNLPPHLYSLPSET